MAIPDRDETSEEATCWSPNIACRGDQRAHSRTFNTRIVDDVLEIEGKRCRLLSISMFTPLDNQPQLIALAAGVVTEYTEQDEVSNADSMVFLRDIFIPWLDFVVWGF